MDGDELIDISEARLADLGVQSEEVARRVLQEVQTLRQGPP